MSDLIHVHVSGEASASSHAWWQALKQYATGADVVTGTEGLGHYSTIRAWAKLNGFISIQSLKRGKGECWVLVRKALSNHRWVVVNYHKLTHLRLRTARKAPLYAVRVFVPTMYDGFNVTAAHMPAHSEGRFGFIKAWSSRVYMAAALGWSEMRFKDRHRIIAADWNLNHRRPWVRAYLRGLFPGTRPGWNFKRLPKGGTIGPRRLIDGPRSDMEIVEHSVILPAAAGFKHRGVRTVYRLGEK